MELTKEIDSIQLRLASLKNHLTVKINSLPQNKAIKPIIGHENCFIISSKDLDINNWSPDYYDFRFQYQKVIELIDKSDLLSFHKTIDKIMKDKKIRIEQERYTLYFHPTVLEYLKQIFN